MNIYCEDCGSAFEFSEREQQFYKSKGYDLPKRCKSCRDQRKNSKRYEIDLPGLGYKVSSFSKNAQIFGLPVDVHGSSIVHKYIICAKNSNEVKYIYLNEQSGIYKFVDTEEEASSHQWSDSIKEINERFQQKYPNYTFILKPQSNWSQLNDDLIIY